MGTVNFTNPGRISHNEILTMYRQHVDPDFKWKNFTVAEQSKILASGRSNNLLETKRLQDFCPSVKDIHTSVEDLLKEYKRKATTKQAKTDFPDVASTLLFVTGGAGFIGSNFINELFNQYKSVRVINFDALYYAGNVNNVNEEIRNNRARYTFIKGNLQGLDFLKHIFMSNRITHVVHFAAQSHVQNSFGGSIQYTLDNVLGTHNLLEAARLHGSSIKKFIHVSTDEVYGQSTLDEDEDHKCEVQSVLSPTNPYAATKAAAEMIVMSYRQSFKMPIVISRGNNVYGPNQYAEKVIPLFIQQLNADQKLTIQGTGDCVRDFLHAHDVANAFIKLLCRAELGEVYNIGCDEGVGISIMDLAKTLIKRIKNTDDYDSWITYIPDRPFNDLRYKISNKKMRSLGWAPTVSFDEGISALIKLENVKKAE